MTARRRYELIDDKDRRSVVKLFTVYSMTVAEIAERMGRHPHTIADILRDSRCATTNPVVGSPHDP